MEKLDILLATYNGEKYLSEQIDSILCQTYKDFRLLISDDCSTDNTRNILNEYSKKDERINLFFQSKNLGVNKNFEFLLTKVKSPYYMFSDQDDIWKKEKIEKSLNTIKSTGSALVYSDLEVVDQSLNVNYESYWKLKGFYNKIKKFNSFESLYLNNFITGCTIISKSEFLSEILPFPKENTKAVLYDYWIAIILSQNHKITYIDEPLIQYRQHKNNTIGSKRKSDNLKNVDEIRKLFIDVKKDHFNFFIKNEEKFKDAEIKLLNRESLKYYEMIEKKHNFNFKNWKLFFKLYKYENFMYKVENFLILNMPIVARILFKIRKLFK